MVIVVPAAGRSKRFPDMRPKYILRDYTGQTMGKKAVEPWLNDENTHIVFGILRDHLIKFETVLHLQSDIPKLNAIYLDQETQGPADTVYQVLQELIREEIITSDESLFIKDCDSFFTLDSMPANFIAVSYIEKHEILKKLSSKSFVKVNDQGIVIDIAEKEVISNAFCVGGYGFESVAKYTDAFEAIASVNSSDEIYVSHVISYLLQTGTTFTTQEVKNYIDVGTAEDWFEYNNKPTVFCDIDGTIIESQSRVGRKSYSSPPVALQENIAKIHELLAKGCQVIFTTSRSMEAYQETTDMLRKLGFGDQPVLMGLHNSYRIVINDYENHAPWPRAVAINIKRDTDTLKEFL